MYGSFVAYLGRRHDRQTRRPRDATNWSFDLNQSVWSSFRVVNLPNRAPFNGASCPTNRAYPWLGEVAILTLSEIVSKVKYACRFIRKPDVDKLYDDWVCRRNTVVAVQSLVREPLPPTKPSHIALLITEDTTNGLPLAQLIALANPGERFCKPDFDPKIAENWSWQRGSHHVF